MARFADVTEEDLTLLLERRDSLSTKNVIRGALNILNKYMNEKDLTLVDVVDNDGLDKLLQKFSFNLCLNY